jgi:hypothetical protein
LQHGHYTIRTPKQKSRKGRTHAAFGKTESGLTLAELLAAASRVQANLFTLDFTSIASHVTGL